MAIDDNAQSEGDDDGGESTFHSREASTSVFAISTADAQVVDSVVDAVPTCSITYFRDCASGCSSDPALGQHAAWLLDTSDAAVNHRHGQRSRYGRGRQADPTIATVVSAVSRSELGLRAELVRTDDEDVHPLLSLVLSQPGDQSSSEVDRCDRNDYVVAARNDRYTKPNNGVWLRSQPRLRRHDCAKKKEKADEANNKEGEVCRPLTPRHHRLPCSCLRSSLVLRLRSLLLLFVCVACTTDAVELSATPPPAAAVASDCCLCPWLTSKPCLQAVLGTLALFLLCLTAASAMFKVSKSYSRKSEHKRETTGAAKANGGASGDYHHIHSSSGGVTSGGPFVTSPPPSVRNGTIRNEGAHAHGARSASQNEASYEARNEAAYAARHEAFQQQQRRSSSTNRSAARGGADYSEGHYVRGRDGQLVPAAGINDRFYDSAVAYGGYGGAQGYSESSTYETREHYERKIRKKTRGERERSRSKSNGLHTSNGSLHNVKVSEVLAANDGLSAKDALLQWARKVTQGYPGVAVNNFHNSWRDGLAFNAILHRYRPNLINWNQVSDKNTSAHERLRTAFDAADNEFGVSKLLDPEDVDVDRPDEKSIITYVSSLYNALPHLDESKEDLIRTYEHDAAKWLDWVRRTTALMFEVVSQAGTSADIARLRDELAHFRAEDLPPIEAELERLKAMYAELDTFVDGTANIPEFLRPPLLERALQELLDAMQLREQELARVADIMGNLDDVIARLERGIGITNEKLDLILERIEEVEARVDTADVAEIQRSVQAIVEDLGALEAPINALFDDVEILKEHNHARTNEFYQQVYGLHQRRGTYLDRIQGPILRRIGVQSETLSRRHAERTKSTFESLEEAIRWVRERLDRLNAMVFHEDLEALEDVFEQHKLDNRDIQDFHQTVKECIARQAEVSAEDSEEYCELLRTLESEYQQLRDLSAGRMLDLDSLIAFIRAAQLELIWIHDREDLEVTRNWSDVSQLDLPMLQNYYKQLLHEIELREKQFNDVHNQGAALLNQRHPAGEVIEIYLRSLQNQWDWLLGLTRCLEGHLRDALNLKS
uniref:Glycine--tRNA ligase n=1 Tax=Panagrellus redivivus TaxID=6233 RepID=A0A7E4VAI7_PANRE